MIKKIFQARKYSITPSVNIDGGANNTSAPVNVRVGGATVMVLPMEKFYRF
ncbi:MAG: hypothetical protein AJITA_01249 [Acetilactobacillus jinshanensis]